MSYRKKLIEVALPLDAINKESAREKSIRHGHPSTLHLWWARRPLAACRAVLFAQLVDDPSSHPDRFPTEEAQQKERERLFEIIEDLVKWENISEQGVLEAARKEILKSTDNNPPPVLDPFCGGGSIPLEAQRLGLEAHASDLNPVAVLITKALIEIPPKFAAKPPVHPGRQSGAWHGAQGLAEDVRYYGEWMRNEAEKRIGHLYPKVKIPKENGGGEATVIAWIWARTVKCPNPACGGQAPLVKSFVLSSKSGKETWVEPVQQEGTCRFEVKQSDDHNKMPVNAKEGTKSGGRGANFKCVLCDTPINGSYIKAEGQNSRMGAQLLAVVAEGLRGRIYLPSSPDDEQLALEAKPTWRPTGEVPARLTGGTCYGYGLTEWGDIFTPRQLLALTTFGDLIPEVHEKIRRDAIKSGMHGNEERLADGGSGAQAYADSVATYLGITVSRLANRCSSICFWDTGGQKIQQVFARQAIPMTWDFVEGNPFSSSSGNWLGQLSFAVKNIESAPILPIPGVSEQKDAATLNLSGKFIVATDPPYYDNIAYADLSDFFYVWLRRSLQKLYPQLFSTLVTPKTQELVAIASRFNGDATKARQFFEEGLGHVFENIRDMAHSGFPITMYYAFKQAENATETINGSSHNLLASTGWETMLEGLLKTGLMITGTWPMRTEFERGLKKQFNVLASSIVLVCRPRPAETSLTTRRDFLNALKQELPKALRTLQHGNIAPVDLAQASIGPGMSIFSRYSKVLEPDGSSMRVRTALALINQVLDEYLAEQEGQYDADTRWALAWFEQHGMEEGAYGIAETLCTAKNTAVSSMEESGILIAKAGKVRLLRRDELPQDWDPSKDTRLTVWEITQHLTRALVDQGSEEAAANLLSKLGSKAEAAHDLAYRLYTICDRKKWAQEALAYNSLVVAWPELVRLASQKASTEGPRQMTMREMR